MEKKEILIPISKIKGLEKVVNSLDFQVEEKSQLTPSDSFENQEDNNFNLKNFEIWEYSCF